MSGRGEAVGSRPVRVLTWGWVFPYTVLTARHIPHLPPACGQGHTPTW